LYNLIFVLTFATSFNYNVSIRVNMKTMYYTIPGYIYFLYILFPLRLWERFVFSNQTEVVVVTLFFACVMLLFTLLKAYQTFSFHLSKIDLMLIIYGIYLLFRFRYPLEKEIFYQAFSITCIYLYFRNFPEKYLTGLFFLLPIAVMIQMLDGVNRFTMPWQNLSHITGIFNNTGLFGGFAALGFVVCAGLFLFTGSGKCNLKTDSCLLRSSQFAIVKSAVLFILCIILSIQAYASGSRASWVAALIAISFLLYWLVLPSLRGALATKQSGIVFFLFVSCLIVITIFFSNYLYHLKKDSADGRLLIARVSMGMVKGSPVFGNGISGFRAEYLNQQADYFRTHSDSTWADLADDVESPFNEFLKVLIEQGIAGVLLFSYLLYSLFEKGAAKNPHCYILQSIVLFILIFGLFSYPLDNLPFVALFVLSIAGLSRNRNPVFTVRISKSKYLRIPLLISLCIVSGIIAVNACLYAKSCLKWNKTLANFASDKEKALSQLEILYPELEKLLIRNKQVGCF